MLDTRAWLEEVKPGMPEPAATTTLTLATHGNTAPPAQQRMIQTCIPPRHSQDTSFTLAGGHEHSTLWHMSSQQMLWHREGNIWLQLVFNASLHSPRQILCHKYCHDQALSQTHTAV